MLFSFTLLQFTFSQARNADALNYAQNYTRFSEKFNFSCFWWELQMFGPHTSLDGKLVASKCSGTFAQDWHQKISNCGSLSFASYTQLHPKLNISDYLNNNHGRPSAESEEWRWTQPWQMSSFYKEQQRWPCCRSTAMNSWALPWRRRCLAESLLDWLVSKIDSMCCWDQDWQPIYMSCCWNMLESAHCLELLAATRITQPLLAKY